jgi:hypothetical protein
MIEVRTEKAFLRFREVWEAWCLSASDTSWEGVGGSEDTALMGFRADLLAGEARQEELQGTLAALRENRAGLIGSLNRIDLAAEAGRLLLVPAGTLHAIAGMSLQLHPPDPGRSLLSDSLRDAVRLDPEGARSLAGDLAELRGEAWRGSKEEAWIPIPAGGETLIVEVQQSSDSTLSVADFHTPFEWRDGGMVFRKGRPAGGIADDDLERSVEMADLEPRSVSRYRQVPSPLPAPPGSTGARLEVLLDDPAVCPYFRVHRLTLRGSRRQPARWVSGRAPAAFLQLAATEGSAELRDGARRGPRIAPGAPVFLPGSCRDPLSVEAREPTVLLIAEPPLGPATASAPGPGSRR